MNKRLVKKEVDSEGLSFIQYSNKINKLYNSELDILDFYEKYLEIHTKLLAFNNFEKLYLNQYAQHNGGISHITDLIYKIYLLHWDAEISYGMENSKKIFLHSDEAFDLLKDFVEICQKHLTSNITTSTINFIYLDVDDILYEELSDEMRIIYDNKHLLECILCDELNVLSYGDISYDRILRNGDILYSIMLYNNHYHYDRVTLLVKPDGIVFYSKYKSMNVIEIIEEQNKKYDYKYVKDKLNIISKLGTPIKTYIDTFKDIELNSQRTKDIIGMINDSQIPEFKEIYSIFINDSTDVYDILNILIEIGAINKVGDISKYNAMLYYSDITKYYYNKLEDYMKIVYDMGASYIITSLSDVVLPRKITIDYIALSSTSIFISYDSVLYELNYNIGAFYIDWELHTDDISILTREAKLKTLEKLFN